MTLNELGITIRENGRVEQRVACPRCAKSDHDDTLGINTASGAFHCFRCGWAGKASIGETQRAKPIARPDDPAEVERRRRAIQQVWDSGLSLTDRAARAVRSYLAFRGLQQILLNPPEVLRAHPGLGYYHAGTRGFYPALLALLSDRDGGPITLHRTYVRPNGDGKAPVAQPKKLMAVPSHGATRGGSIKLYGMQSDGVLGLAEGLENALTLHLMYGVSAWSAFCAGNLEHVHLPRSLRELYIAVDVDQTGVGERAARALARRLMSREPAPVVHLVFPSRPHTDLNDEWRARKGALH